MLLGTNFAGQGAMFASAWLTALWNDSPITQILAPLALGALLSWAVTWFYYRRASRHRLLVTGAKPWRLLAKVDDRIRERLAVLVDGEPVTDLARMRFRIANVGYTAVRPQSPIRLALPADAALVEAAITHVGPEGLAVAPRLEPADDGTSVLFDTPLPNPGDRFAIELLVRDLPDDYVPRFEVISEGVPPHLQPVDRDFEGDRYMRWVFGSLVYLVVVTVIGAGRVPASVLGWHRWYYLLGTLAVAAIVWAIAWLVVRNSRIALARLVPVGGLIVSGLVSATDASENPSDQAGTQDSTTDPGQLGPSWLRSELSGLVAGDRVHHGIFGEGRVVGVEASRRVVRVVFEDGERRLVDGHAPLWRIADAGEPD